MEKEVVNNQYEKIAGLLISPEETKEDLRDFVDTNPHRDSIAYSTNNLEGKE
jgi:hypothetical protein